MGCIAALKQVTVVGRKQGEVQVRDTAFGIRFGIRLVSKPQAAEVCPKLPVSTPATAKLNCPHLPPYLYDSVASSSGAGEPWDFPLLLLLFKSIKYPKATL